MPIVVEMLIQQVHFTPNRKAISLLKLPSVSIDHVFRHPGLSKALVSDRDHNLGPQLLADYFYGMWELNCALLRPPIHQMMASMSVFTGRWR